MEIENDKKNELMKSEEKMEIENIMQDNVLIYYFGTNYYEM